MTTTPARILMVDDMEENLIALEAILTSLGEPLIRARSGEEAMKALLRQDFAVVLLDVLMPGMDGLETTAGIKRLDRTKDVPIILLTGTEDSAGYAFRGYAAGAADFLQKPFDPWMLRAKVSVFLDLHRKNQQLQRMLARERDQLAGLAEQFSAIERQLTGSGLTDAPELARRVAAMETGVRELQRHYAPERGTASAP